MMESASDTFTTSDGIREAEETWSARVPQDVQGVDPEEATASRNLRIRSAMDHGMSQEEAEQRVDAAIRENRSRRTAPAARGPALQIDLGTINVPIMAINGEYDRPYEKTFRLWREARDFTNVVLPGKSHLTAITAGYIPPQYGRSLKRFIDGNDG